MPAPLRSREKSLEGDVEHRVQVVFDPPVASLSVRGAHHRAPGRSVIARLAMRLAGVLDVGPNRDQAGHPGRLESSLHSGS